MLRDPNRPSEEREAAAEALERDISKAQDTDSVRLPHGTPHRNHWIILGVKPIWYPHVMDNIWILYG